MDDGRWFALGAVAILAGLSRLKGGARSVRVPSSSVDIDQVREIATVAAEETSTVDRYEPFGSAEAFDDFCRSIAALKLSRDRIYFAFDVIYQGRDPEEVLASCASSACSPRCEC